MDAEHGPEFSNAAVWLMMVKEGDRWTAAEIGERMKARKAELKGGKTDGRGRH